MIAWHGLLNAVGARAETSARRAGLMSMLTLSSEGRSCSTLRALMIGLVMAGCPPAHATAGLTGMDVQVFRELLQKDPTGCQRIGV